MAAGAPDEVACTFAAVGDVHGAMTAMVERVREQERALGCQVDFVLQVGDFEPHRTEADLQTMAAPSRHRRMGEFQEFVAGRAAFPWPVRFIGGNHEPYGYLDDLAPLTEIVRNCAYLGRAGRGRWAGCTFAWLGGVHVADRFDTPRPPITAFGTVSNKEFVRFTQDDVLAVESGGPADVLILHDWPSGIVAPEDEAEFESQRRSLRYDDVGNEWARFLVEALTPRLVLCGHLHKAYRRHIEVAPGHGTDVCCLGKVDSGPGAVALFRVGSDGSVRELGGVTPPGAGRRPNVSVRRRALCE